MSRQVSGKRGREGETRGILATLPVCVVSLVFVIEGGGGWWQGDDRDVLAACMVVHIY